MLKLVFLITVLQSLLGSLVGSGLQVRNTFCYRKIFFLTGFLDCEETSSFGKFRVASNFEMVEFFHFSIVVVVESEDFLHEFLVWLVECLTIFFNIQNSLGLRFYFVNIGVVNLRNGEWLFLSLGLFLSFCFLNFSAVLSSESQFGGNTVLEMTSLFLPKFFQFFTLSLLKTIILCVFTDWDVFPLDEFCILDFIEFIARNSNVTFVFISSRINYLNLVKSIWDHFAQILPVYLIFTISCLVDVGSFEVNN